MRPARCRECGVELTRGPETPCPLCGTGPLATNAGRLTSLSEVQREKNAARSDQGGAGAPPGVTDVDRYQSDVQRLREQLRRLRSGAEAV
jgi:hypothetical protein